ncbi:MAG: hypothetical protein ACR2IJ_02730 [Fluviibacter sp.]
MTDRADEIKNVLECNIYIEGVEYPILRKIYFHRESGGFSRIPAFAIVGKRDDIAKEIAYQLNRIGYKKDLTKE